MFFFIECYHFRVFKFYECDSGRQWDYVMALGGERQPAELWIHETKNDERRALPLGKPAFKEIQKLSELRRIDTNLLFPDETGKKPIDIRNPWERAIKKAGIKDFRFHDLRHSAASYLAMNGASLAEIAEVLGHKTLQMVKRYSHLSEQHTANVVSKMNDKIFGST